LDKFKKTTTARSGGLFVGKSHAKGGIPAIVVDTGQPIEVEGGEVIINKEASKKYWKELSKINQSAGNGVPIPPPMEFSKDVSSYKTGGKISMSAIRQGTEIELEHASTIESFKNQGISVKAVAQKIAKDHLKENPNYYKILTKLKLAKGGEVVCRSCSNSWLKHHKDVGMNVFDCEKCGNNNHKFYKGGATPDMSKGEIKAFYDSPEGNKVDAETFKEWKSLVNMSTSELKTFYNSVEGKEAGLSESEAKNLGISNGRTSARWVMKMKDLPYESWTSDMWIWAKKQISFIKRMRGNKGSLYDDKGKKTRKHTSLLIWGHNPEKFNLGGNVEEFYIGSEYSGKQVRNIVSKYDSQEGTDMEGFALSYIKLKDKYILDYVNIERLIENDSNLHTYIADEYNPNNDVEYDEIRQPILLGTNEYSKQENTVLDGYHRILQQLYNNEEDIFAFIPINTKYDIRFKTGGSTISKTPAPQKFAKGKRIAQSNKGGDCYEIAGKIAIDRQLPNQQKFNGTPYVVHAEVSGQGAISGIRYGHAWVEDDLNVYDFSNGRAIVFPKQPYYNIGNVQTVKPKYYKYTFEKAIEKMLKTGHYGSWDLQTESGL